MDWYHKLKFIKADELLIGYSKCETTDEIRYYDWYFIFENKSIKFEFTEIVKSKKGWYRPKVILPDEVYEFVYNKWKEIRLPAILNN